MTDIWEICDFDCRKSSTSPRLSNKKEIKRPTVCRDVVTWVKSLPLLRVHLCVRRSGACTVHDQLIHVRLHDLLYVENEAEHEDAQEELLRTVHTCRRTSTCHIMPCHITLFIHVIQYHAILSYVIPCHTISYHIILYYTMSFKIGLKCNERKDKDKKVRYAFLCLHRIAYWLLRLIVLKTIRGVGAEEERMACRK